MRSLMEVTWCLLMSSAIKPDITRGCKVVSWMQLSYPYGVGVKPVHG